MNKNSVNTNLLYVFPIVILCYTFTLLWGWFPYSHSIIPILIGLSAGLLLGNKYFLLKPVKYLFFFVLVALLNVFAKDYNYSSVSGVFYKTIELLLPAIMTYIVLLSDNEKILNVTIELIVWMLIINAIGTFVVDVTMPGSIRIIQGQIRETGDSSIATAYYKMGVSNYILPHALPSMIPILIMGVKSVKKRSIWFLLIGVLIACVMLVFFSGATTPLLTTILAIIIAAATSDKGGTKRFVIMGIVSILFLIIVNNDNLMLSLLRGADDVLNNEGYFHGKILEFENLIIYGETSGDMEQRGDLYGISFNAILNHPILGVNYEIGGHSTLLDTWGYLGLVGFVPFIFFIFAQIRWTSKQILKSSRFYYYECVILAFIMLALKNTAGWESWLFLFTVVPLLIKYIENNQKQIN